MIKHTESIRSDLIVSKNRARKAILSGVGTSTTVVQEARDWLRTQAKHHWYFYECQETGKLRIAFHDKNDAMMWKLAWH
jgi:fructoselysine-6-P-deglycase FrlB-like protein